MKIEDTIVSIATSPGVGAIGIIRISGREAFRISKILFKGKNKNFDDVKSHSVVYGWVIDPEDGHIVDEVLLSKMALPNTYTREDIVEINCHGSPIILKKIIDIVCILGARVAEPGEFTKRAFLNGRIDLTQAEAVMDVINSRADQGLKASMRQLEGKLSSGIKPIRDRLIDMLSHIDASVDYPEYDIEQISKEKIIEGCTFVKEKLEDVLSTFDKGKILREGLEVLILGVPNVGKSSLLNSLSGRNSAIVTNIPGTTRDIIQEDISVAGIQVNIIDTAGIRDTKDLVENIGVDRSLEYIDKSDLILFMVDASASLTADDYKIYERIKDKKSVLLINKMDKKNKENVEAIYEKFEDIIKIPMSVEQNIGFFELENYIKDNFMLGNIKMNNELILTNSRHKAFMVEAIKSIIQALESINIGMPLDIISIDIQNTADSLGHITGESVKEDVLKEIFSRFCIGK